MKVVVYAICKNEAQFVRRWMDSMSEADRVVVLDTGSTDETVSLLRGRGAEVTEETIVPWRFDTARNRSLDLVPEDAEPVEARGFTQAAVFTDRDRLMFAGRWETSVLLLNYNQEGELDLLEDLAPAAQVACEEVGS